MSPPEDRKHSGRRPGRPRLAHQSDTVESILKAALREFATHGFEGARISEIATDAGVAKPLVHYHFETKEQLWKSAVARAFAEAMSNFQRLPQELKGLDGISFAKVFVRRYVHFVAKHPELGRVVVIEAYKPSERARWLLQTHVLPTLGLAVAMIEDAQRRGLVKDIPARQIAAMLNGAVNVYFNEEVMRRRLAGEDGAVEFDDDEIDRFADSLLETFSYGLIVA